MKIWSLWTNFNHKKNRFLIFFPLSIISNFFRIYFKFCNFLSFFSNLFLTTQKKRKKKKKKKKNILYGFSDDLMGNRSNYFVKICVKINLHSPEIMGKPLVFWWFHGQKKLIRLNLLNVRSEIWWISLTF